MLKAGVAKEKITPPLGVDLWGYGFYLNRKSTGINDELYARAIEFDDGRNKVLIIACDLGGLGRYFVQECKKEIFQSLGIPKDNISVCVTHTHSGPAMIYMEGLGRVDKKYMIFLKEKIIAVAKKADKNREEVKIGVGKGKSEIGFNRVVKDGLIDNELLVLRVDNMDSEVKAIMYNCGVHAVSLRGDNCLISADWPGYTNKKIEEEKHCISIFLQGACGDINVKDPSGYEGLKENGKNLAREIFKVQEKLKWKKNLKIRVITKTIDLPLRILNEEDIEKIMGKYQENRKNENFEKFIQEWRGNAIKEINKNPRDLLPTEIQFIQIGKDICFVMQPSELFTKWQLKIKEISPCENTLVVGYANDYVGYIPDEDDFDREGYAAHMVPMITGFFPFENDVGRFLVEEIRKIL